jgi:predicted glycosyltransferase
MKRILVYSHDTFGLGNIRRMLEISKHLISQDEEISVLIVSGSPMLHAFRIPERIDYIKLPCLRRTIAGEYDVKSLDIDYSDMIRLRANLLLSAITDFEPDLILVDKKPFGVGNELAPAFEMLQRRHSRPRIVLLLRDILDSPAATSSVWKKNGYYDAIRTYYDKVLVVGTREVFDLPREYAFPAGVRDKVQFCGYIERPRSTTTRAQTRAKHGLRPDEPWVLFTVGGGEDGARLLRTYLEGLTTKHCPHRGLIVCGPEMKRGDRAAIAEQAADHAHIEVADFADDMMALMDAADLVVSMGGYNTTCELLTLRKRAIIVPRVEPVQEQWIRAQRLQHLGLFRAIHPDELTPALLRDAIDGELDRINVRPCGLYQIEMNGLTEIASAIDSEIQSGCTLGQLKRLAQRGRT